MNQATQDLISTLDYVRRYSGSTIVIKLGGASLEDAKLVESICEDLHRIHRLGLQVVLVHGGGPAINAELTRRGISWNFHEGQRITTPEMMDAIESTLSGTINKRLVRALNAAGVRAVGMSGVDGGLLKCRQANPVLGQVGAVETVETDLLRAIAGLSSSGAAAIPVIAPVGLGQDGLAYNINADWAAAKIASSMGAKKMLFLTDQDGILDPEKKLISELDATELESLIETGVVTGGMMAKARTIVHALKNDVTDVHIFNARRPHGLLEELFTDRGAGTICRVRSRAYAAMEGIYQ